MQTNREFFKSLSEADWDKAEAIETEIGNLLSEGFTEELGIAFVRTVLEIRAAIPQATVGGVFDAALSAGLAYIGDANTIERMRRAESASATGVVRPKQKARAGKRRTVRGV